MAKKPMDDPAAEIEDDMSTGDVTTLYTRDFRRDLKRRVKLLKAKRELVSAKGETLGDLYNIVIEVGVEHLEREADELMEQAEAVN